jgi:hypothetical protein
VCDTFGFEPTVKLLIVTDKPYFEYEGKVRMVHAQGLGTTPSIAMYPEFTNSDIEFIVIFKKFDDSVFYRYPQPEDWPFKEHIILRYYAHKKQEDKIY